MNWLDPKEWLLILAFCLVSVLGYAFWSHRLVAEGEAVGYKRAVGEYTLKLSKELAVAAKQTKEWQDAKDVQLREAQARENQLRANAVSLANERGGLRNQLAAARSQLSSATCGSVREYATTLSGLFESCVAEYTAVAEAASGHASDSLKLQMTWPK